MSRLPDEALGVESEVIDEGGRWVLFVTVTTWNAAAVDEPLARVRHRIRDYRTREEAETARSWVQRAASRTRPRPPFGL